jgi:hypothetical protein
MFAAHPGVFIPLLETGAFLKPGRAEHRWSLLEREAMDSGKPHFCEKTPKHVQCLNTIREHVPRARMILMVRDGRDVAASYIKRTGAAQHGAERWIEDNRTVIAEEDAADVSILRYEDLIEAPEASLRRICAFADVPFSADMLDYHREDRMWFGTRTVEQGNGQEGKGHKKLRNWQINQPIFDGRGKWRGLLSQEDLDVFRQGEAARMLRHFGYPED